jgi:DNA-binding response OmpR family regulator
MKVLVVDDDPDIVEAVGICFALRWPEVDLVEAPDGQTALERFESEQPDVVILDIGLPDMSGLEVCGRLRGQSDVPIVMLTAKDGELDKVKGLETGADDYITKPFSHLELLARIKAVLRRSAVGSIGSNDPPFESGGFMFDFAARQVSFSGHRVQLTPTEYNLLYHLTKNHPRVVQHKTLLAKVWGREYVEETEYLKVHVQRIRSKFAEIDPDFNPVENERGIGYRLNVGQPAGAVKA